MGAAVWGHLQPGGGVARLPASARLPCARTLLCSMLVRVAMAKQQQHGVSQAYLVSLPRPRPRQVTEETEEMRFNTAIAAMMEFVNGAYKWQSRPRAALEPFILLLAPYAPHLGEGPAGAAL